MSRRYVEVALPPPLARELTYGLPADLDPDVQLGSLVLVPVARQLMTGIVVRLADAPPPAQQLAPEAIRDVAQALAGEALLDPEIVELCRWMADYYFAPLASALMAALPRGIEPTSRRLVQLCPNGAAPASDDPLETAIRAQLRAGPVKVTTLQHRLGRDGLEKALQRLRRAGAVEISPVLQSPQVSARRAQFVRVAAPGRAETSLAELQRRAPRQAACLALIGERGAVAKKTLVGQGFGYSILKNLSRRGFVDIFEEEVLRDPLAHIEPEVDPVLRPTADQQQVLGVLEAALEERAFFPALLQGVTGSGKTLIYLNLAERALAQGRSSIVLVPEIALAWQMVRRFRARFGASVAVMHSRLSDGERYDTWRRLRRGEQRIVIGARSAVLAPVRDPGLIVVDEEHDSSYKQEDLQGGHPLNYNARDLALVRGQRQGAVVILGSATPSLESYWNARAHKYHLLALPRRVDDRPLPRIEVADMRQEPFQKQERAIFSRALRLKMQERLARGEKIVLLQNRRGFAPIVTCTSCGEAVQCESCRVSLTYHRGKQTEVRCHYCDFRSPLPPACPACNSADLRLEGVGTQKVEEALLQQFPGIRVIRMDVDTTGWKGAHDHLLERFRRGEADVLLGTQMVAKGLDFPEVTLVGVISADTGMHLPDFRAAERSFQLLTQVAGRSGRGQNPGEVVIQTRLPESPVLQAAADQEFEVFVERELEERRTAGFPPFGRLIVFRWRGKEEEKVEQAARKGSECLAHTINAEAVLLGPAPAPLARLRGHYRWQTLMRGPSARRLHAFTARALPPMREMAAAGATALTVNVDPLTMM